MEFEHRVTLRDDRTLACLELGDARGHAVLYLHGYPGSRFEARLLKEAAQQLHVRLLAPDRPGFGASTFQNGRTIGAWGADVRQLADAFDLEHFAVIGMSGGGPYALACAATIPERVSRVALVGAVGPIARGGFVDQMLAIHKIALATGARAPWLARLAIGLAARAIRGRPDSFVALTLAKMCPADQAVLADPRYRSRMIDSTVEALRQGGRGVAHELQLLVRPWDIELRTISKSIAIWHGLADTVVPVAMARSLASVLAHSELHCLPGEGHLSLIVRHGERVFVDLISSID